MRNETLKHAPIMPIAAKPSQYGIDPSLVKSGRRNCPVCVPSSSPNCSLSCRR